MKKRIKIFITFIIILNFIVVIFAPKTYALNVTLTNATGEGAAEKELFESIAEKGVAPIHSQDGDVVKSFKTTDSSMGSLASNLGSAITPIFGSIDDLLGDFLSKGGYYHTDSTYGASETGIVTAASLIFGEFITLDGKPYQLSTDYNSSVTPSTVTNGVDEVKKNISGWYQGIRNIVLVASIAAVIYSSVRVVIVDRRSGSAARELASWKKVLGRWVFSLFLIMTIYLVLILISVINDNIMDNLWEIRLNLESGGYKAFEVAFYEAISTGAIQNGGLTYLAYVIEYVFFIFVQLMFAIKYILRAVVLMFFYAIAPFIVFMNGFNLMRGKDGDVLKDFFKNFLSLTFMQPLHAMLYLVIMFSVSEIASTIPLAGIFVLFMLYRSDKIAKTMLQLETGISIFGNS